MSTTDSPFSYKHFSPDTAAVVSGRPSRALGEPVNPPVVLSATYVSAGVPQPGQQLYGRYGNETWEFFEQAVADLEGGQFARVFSSGIAAVNSLLNLVPAGGRIVMPTHAYLMSLHQAADMAARSGIEIVQVDISDTAAVLEALAPGADLLWIESPTNPMLEVADIPALAEAAHAAGALVAVDNTFATPLLQRPLEFGADLVLHSATKYLSGHSDVLLGVVVTNDQGHADYLNNHRITYGAIAGPWEVWLALRGLRTLDVRLQRQLANAQELAVRLANHPDLVAVRHPSLPNDPGHVRAKQLMKGFGAILTIQPRGGQEAADRITEAVQLWVPATSLGGVESMLERRRRFDSEAPTVPEDLLRLSVGIENVEDLWADLDQAIRSAH